MASETAIFLLLPSSCLTRYILGLASFFVSNPLLVIASPLGSVIGSGAQSRKTPERESAGRSLTILGCHHLGLAGNEIVARDKLQDWIVIVTL